MSNTDGTCEYVLDPDDPETWGGEEGDECYVDEQVLNEAGVWTCPHDTQTNKNLCVFHQPIEEKNTGEAADAFIKSIKGLGEGGSIHTRCHLEYIGAKFEDFDLAEEELEAENETLAMEHTEIAGAVDWSDTVFNISQIRLNGLKCAGKVDFSNIKFTGTAYLSNASFKDEVQLTEGVFKDSTEFYDVDFNKSVDFEKTEFSKLVVFNNSVFKGQAGFFGVTFDSGAQFNQTEFKKRATFRTATFRDGTLGTSIREAEFDDMVNFQSEFRGNTTFKHTSFAGYANFLTAKFDKSDFSDVKFEAEANFDMAEFANKASFNNAEFWGEIMFENSAFRGYANFQNVSLDGATLEDADLSGASFTGASLCNVNLESALLNRATLYAADLRGAKISGTLLGDVRIDEDTKFLGCPSDGSDSSPHTLSDIFSRPKCVYDPNYEEDNEHVDVDKAKSVYRALEELGGKHARPRLQARSFVRRQDLQKQDYWNSATADDASLEERLIAGARYSRARVARATLLYGESPWRVIAWSLGIIFSFALLYPLGGWMKPADGDPITYAQITSNPVEILNSVYYSTLTYTALGFGDFQPVGLGRLLTTVETGLGAVMLALLVFILGRRAAR